MYHERKPPATYGAEYSLEYEVAEAIQRKRKRGAVGLDQDEAMYDMERMGVSTAYLQHDEQDSLSDAACSLHSCATLIEERIRI